MTLKLRSLRHPALPLVAGAMLALSLASPASPQSGPQYDKRGRPIYGQSGPNYSYQQGPHTRIYAVSYTHLTLPTICSV